MVILGPDNMVTVRGTPDDIYLVYYNFLDRVRFVEWLVDHQYLPILVSSDYSSFDIFQNLFQASSGQFFDLLHLDVFYVQLFHVLY